MLYQISAAFAQDVLVMSLDGYSEQTLANQQDVILFNLKPDRCLTQAGAGKGYHPLQTPQALAARNAEGDKWLNQLSVLSLTDGSMQDLPLTLLPAVPGGRPGSGTLSGYHLPGR